MCIVEKLKEVASSSQEEIEQAVRKLDDEMAAIQTEIISFCAQGDLDCAWDCLAQFKRTEELSDFARKLRGY
jgi:hypothetical protein